MRKKLLTAGLIAAFALSATPAAFADSGHRHFGTISGFTDSGASGDFYIMLDRCDGETHKFEFKADANRDVWRNRINAFMDDDAFVNIGDDGRFVVDVMANIPNGSCDMVDDIRDALDDKDDDDDHDDDDDNEVRIETRIKIKSHSDDSDDDHMEDDDHMDDDGRMEHELRFRARVHLNEDERHEVHSELKHRLHLQIQEHLNDGRLTNREKLVLRERLIKQAKFEDQDEEAIELENRFDLEHANRVEIKHGRDEDNVRPHNIQMRGTYLVDGDAHVLANPQMHILAKLDVSGEEDFSALEGKAVLVSGTAVRSSKTIDVESMRELPSNEPKEESDVKTKWHVGASLYHDVDTTDQDVWFTQYLDLLYDRGVFNGYEDGSFGASNNVTVAEIAKVVAEAARHEFEDDSDFSNLTDEQRRHWAKKYLRHALRLRLFSSIEDENRPATREEVIEAILKAYGITDVTAAEINEAFPDTDNRFVLKAKALGIIDGYADGTFRPNDPINRAEVAKIISKAIELLEEDNGAEEEVEELLDELNQVADDEDELEEWLENEEN